MDGEKERKRQGCKKKKKGDDSGKGGELVGEGERWDGGDAATIRSALCLVTKKKRDGWVSLTGDRKECKKDKKTGRRVEWMVRKKGNDRGARKKKGGRQWQGRGTCRRG